MKTSPQEIIAISEFEEVDRVQLSELYSKAVRDTFTWFAEEKLAKISFDDDTKGEYILVARSAGIIAGFVSIWLPDSFIHHLYVTASLQNRGIGKQLLSAALEKLNGNATLKCLTKNQQAIDFYTKNKGSQRLISEAEDGKYILFGWSPEIISG